MLEYIYYEKTKGISNDRSARLHHSIIQASSFLRTTTTFTSYPFVCSSTYNAQNIDMPREQQQQDGDEEARPSPRPPEEQWVDREMQISVERHREGIAIEEEDDHDHGIAVVPASNTGMDWIARCTWLMTILIIAGSIGVGILLLSNAGSSNSQATPTASTGTTTTGPAQLLLSPSEYYNVLYDHLLHVRQVQDLRDPSTPTYEALEWMAFQDGTELQLLLVVGNNENDSNGQEQEQPSVLLDVPRMEQRFALAVFFFATAGAEFWNSDWLRVGTHECEFDGVICADRDDEYYEDDHDGGLASSTSSPRGRLAVTSLELHQRSLLGALPQELAWLIHLEQLDLHLNRLHGTLPPLLFQELSKLNYFDIGFNDLTGSLPDDWSAMTSLRHMSAQGNTLTGSLPKALPLLSLEYLSLDLNAITGTIPLREWNAQARLYDELLALPLQEQSGSGGETVSSSSSELFNRTRGSVALKLLDLGNTQVGGTLPPLIGSTLSQLRSLGLYQTQVYGTLPSEIGQLVELEELSMGGTQLNGTIPMELWESLSNLQWMVLSATGVSGTFPSQVANLASLQVLNVVHTNWSGSLPTELGALSHLEWLQLSNTDIDGSIPSQLGQLSKLSKS
jgi:hypothetical protein